MSSHSLVGLSTQRLGSLAQLESLLPMAPALAASVAALRDATGPGAEMLGWIDLPERTLKQNDELKSLKATAARLRKECDVLVVIGIGGSYLGARAVLEALSPAEGPEILFAGHHLEGQAYSRLLKQIEGRRVGVNVISKSGTTTEPAIAFRLLLDHLETSAPEEVARRIVATTDARKGALRLLANERGFDTFAVPDDVGGRFSVLTPVGLLPLAAAGVDVDQLLAGAAAEAERCAGGTTAGNPDAAARTLLEIPAIRYAASRHAAHLGGCSVEVLASFFPSLHYVCEWWKQLYGESEGKQGRGLFPAAVDYTTDLHSMGQYMQEGRRFLLETFLHVGQAAEGPVIPARDDDLDGLNYLAGRRVNEVNAQALEAVSSAHESGGVANMTVTLPGIDAHSLGSLLYFFEYAVGVSGGLLGVNPYDQPGVEAYKTNLFRLLGKPGFGK